MRCVYSLLNGRAIHLCCDKTMDKKQVARTEMVL